MIPHALAGPLAPWLARVAGDLDSLNRAAAELGLRSGGGQPLRFVAPLNDGCAYEQRIFDRGEVATRPGNAHDYYNALVWLAFPRAKAAINRRHAAELVSSGSYLRGPVRDALTQFDECGIVVLCADMALWQGIRQHRWQEVLAEQRQEVLGRMGFLLFGHASHDAMAAPYRGLCAKALCFPVAPEVLALSQSEQTAHADQLLADFLDTQPLTPRCWQALPLLGIPGVTEENEDPDYYNDRGQFRPKRLESRREVR